MLRASSHTFSIVDGLGPGWHVFPGLSQYLCWECVSMVGNLYQLTTWLYCQQSVDINMNSRVLVIFIFSLNELWSLSTERWDNINDRKILWGP